MLPEENNLSPNSSPEPTPTPPINNLGGDVQPVGYPEPIIRPLSPELDIRNAAMVAANMIRPATPSPLPPIDSTGNQNMADNTEVNEQPTLVFDQSITETESFKADLPPVLDDEPVRKKSKGLKIFITILLLLIGLGLGCYFFVLPRFTNSQQAIDNLTAAVLRNAENTEVSLVSEALTNTTYLRPEQWNKLEVLNGVVSRYGTVEQVSAQPVAMVTVVQTLPDSYAASASKDGYTQLRRLYLTSTIIKLPETIKADVFAACTTKPEPKVIEDTKKLNDTVGLTLVTSTCVRSDGEYTVKARSVVGSDARLRTITIAATAKAWEENEVTYQKILESIAVTK